MKSTFLVLLAFYPLLTFSEVTIQNFFTVDQNETVFRGREPGKNISQLESLNVTDVIIFKNDTKGEVVRELAALETLGMNAHHIPFQWKDIPSMQVACEQVIEALAIVKKVRASGGSIFFHCTAGEDRTGLLSGLFKMIDEDMDQKTAFEEEMCAKGYSDGNVKKPKVVTSAIEQGLTPLFITMAAMVENGQISSNKLDKKVCKNLKVTTEKKKCR